MTRLSKQLACLGSGVFRVRWGIFSPRLLGDVEVVEVVEVGALIGNVYSGIGY